MKLTVLYENKTLDESLSFGHGLSLYIEVFNKKILFDTGRDSIIISNAKKLGVDLDEVDYAIISHYHYDHSGGLIAFMEANRKAKIIVASGFFDSYYTVIDGIEKSISLDRSKFDTTRFIFIEDGYQIDENIKIINQLGYPGDNLLNDKFKVKKDHKLINDNFSHELALIVDEKENRHLISGCFHSGVVNAIKKAEADGTNVTHAAGGFHLSNLRGKTVSEIYFKLLCKYLRQKDIKCYTGHCTGAHHFERMKGEYQLKASYMKTGSSFIL